MNRDLLIALRDRNTALRILLRSLSEETFFRGVSHPSWTEFVDFDMAVDQALANALDAKPAPTTLPASVP